MPKTRGGKDKAGANGNWRSSTRSQLCRGGRSTIQQDISSAAADNNQQQLAPVSPSMLFTSVSTQESHIPVFTTASSKVARPLTVNDISSIVQEVLRYLPQLQGQDNHRIHNLPSLLPLSVEIKSVAPLENSPLRPVLINCI